MKKTLIILAVIIGSIVILGIVGSITGAFQIYTVPSSANEPTIKTGSRIFVSNLKKPKLFDFVVYHTEMEPIGKYKAVHRLCGMAGDVVEIRNGDLYVNGKLADDKFATIVDYAIALSDYPQYDRIISIEEARQNNTRDSIYTAISSDLIKQQHIKGNRIILNANESDEYISKVFSHNWTRDNFGPVTVPSGYFFVLGDNRHESQDSRYTGFIPSDQFVATVLWKH